MPHGPGQTLSVLLVLLEENQPTSVRIWPGAHAHSLGQQVGLISSPLVADSRAHAIIENPTMYTMV